jgi:phage shock protein C
VRHAVGEHSGRTPTDEENPVDDIRNAFGRAGLVRTRNGVLGGVCAGLGRKLGIEPNPARWLFIIVLLLIPGSQLLVYPVLWVLMPREAEPAAGSWPTTAPATP